MHCYPRMLNATFAAILDLLTSLLCHITRPFHSSSSTQHLSKTALVVIDQTSLKVYMGESVRLFN